MGAYDYPDTLGYITGGPHASFNGIQAALAVSPRTVRTGHIFHALLLAQNNTGAAVELNAALSLPGSILRRQTGRFEASDSQQVRLRPGETGYLLMPVTCQPDAATGDNYRLGVSVNARPLTQPFPVRTDSESRPPDLTTADSDSFSATLLPGGLFSHTFSLTGSSMRSVAKLAPLDAPAPKITRVLRCPPSIPKSERFTP